jgi:predicted ribosome quality control (RQC) complex YloA/Tae2 family protein
MVGKSGRDNHRLTFKLAHPEDFWLHALGVPGAHVVVRNPRRQTHPSPATLSEAAEAAAWFSEAREQPQVDVQWTRRKYVRKIRGASPGTVRVKRSETVRVRPRRPGALEGRG